MKMNYRELYIANKYRKEGWKPIHTGAPDFVMLKVEDRKILDMLAVEVKSKKGKLTYEQKVWKEIFEKAKIPYRLEVVE